MLFGAGDRMSVAGGMTWKAVWKFQTSLFHLCFFLRPSLKLFIKLDTG